MSIPKERRGFFQRLSKNLDHVDKKTLLTQLVAESESHQNWLNVFDRLAEGVVIVSPDGQIDFINAAAQKMLKVSVSTEKNFWTQLADQDLRDFFATQLPRLSSEVLQTFRVLHPKERNLKLQIGRAHV